VALIDHRRPGRTGRCLVCVLLLALALTACGRDTPRVTADDGRDVARPSGGIWIPETRQVQDEPEREDEEPTEVLAAEADAGREASAEAPPTPEPTLTADRGGDPEDTDPARPSTPASEATQDGGRSTRTDRPEWRRDRPGAPGDAPAGRADDDEDDPHADEAEPDDDALDEPEVVGACGVERDGHDPEPERIRAAVERLRDTLATRFPDTQAGAWIVEGERLVVQVGFTEQVQASLRWACEEFEHPGLLEGVRAQLSSSELQELASRVLADREALRDGRPPAGLPEEIRATGGRYAAEVAHEVNGLRVILADPDPALRDAFREHYAERIEVVAGEVDDDGEIVAAD
jgi:hypothetical protein